MRRRRQGRRMAATAILAAWVGALGWQGARQSRLAADAAAGLGPRRIAPGAVFFAVELDGRQIGLAGLTVDTSTTGYSLLEALRLDLPAVGGTARHVLRGESRLTRSFRVSSATFSLSETYSQVQLTARVLEDSLLFLSGSQPGRPRRPLASAAVDNLLLEAALPLRLATAGGLADGYSATFDALAVLPGIVASHTVRVTAESTFVVADSAERDADGTWHVVAWDTVRARRVEDLVQGAQRVLWVDPEGRPVLSEHAFGPRIRRGVFEMVSRGMLGREMPAGLVPGRGPAGAIILTAALPHRARSESTVVVVSRRDGQAWTGAATMFAGGRQRVSGDTVIIGGLPVDQPDVELLRDRYAVRRNEDHNLLSQAAVMALKTYAPLGDTVAALTRWVARDVRLDTLPAAPVAPGDVLRATNASAEGKARLLALLLRTVAIPARVVSGVVVWDPTLPGYTWVETLHKGAWQAVDPLSGRIPASTALLRVTEGAARPLVLVPLVGALETTLVTPPRGAGRR